MAKCNSPESVVEAVWGYLVSLIKRGRSATAPRGRARLFIGGVAALWAMSVSAQYTTYLEPAFLYNWSGGPYFTTVAGAFANAESRVEAVCAAGSTCTLLGLQPDPSYHEIYDGNYYANEFYVQTCESGSCVDGGWTDIFSEETCPASFSLADLHQVSGAELLACQKVIPAGSQPSLNYCRSCFDNPIYASSGEKLQVETDYSGVPGLQFTRSYLSSKGYFASVLTQGFIDDSSPAGTVVETCYPGTWTENSQTEPYCYAYISGYPYVDSGVALYFLNTAEGRTIQFTGPNNAVTQSADTNERVAQITFNGANAWQVTRQDDSVEIYSEKWHAGSAHVARRPSLYLYVFNLQHAREHCAPPRLTPHPIRPLRAHAFLAVQLVWANEPDDRPGGRHLHIWL
jgi:hypothetical protein